MNALSLSNSSFDQNSTKEMKRYIPKTTIFFIIDADIYLN